jgi:hypothetical protein
VVTDVTVPALGPGVPTTIVPGTDPEAAIVMVYPVCPGGKVVVKRLYLTGVKTSTGTAPPEVEGVPVTV